MQLYSARTFQGKASIRNAIVLFSSFWALSRTPGTRGATTACNMDELVVYQAGLPRYPRIFTRDSIIAAETEFAVTVKVMEVEYKGDFIV